MFIRTERERPGNWHAYRRKTSAKWLTPFLAVNWLFTWIAHFLSRWVFLEVLEYLGSFSILVAVIFYFAESGDRVKQKHYQAWQVINTAQGKGGSGGRIEALQELNADHVPLVGIDLTDSFLQGIDLDKAELLRSNFSSADLRGSSFESANLSYASFNAANLRSSHLHAAHLDHADFHDADLFGADLSRVDATGTHFDNADLRNANLKNLNWRGIASLRAANLFGARNLPAGFADWAHRQGAVFLQSDDQ